MAEVVNLRRFSKARLRSAAEAVAVRHRVTFGQKREERDALAREAGLVKRRLDGHRLTSAKSAAPEAGSADD